MGVLIWLSSTLAGARKLVLRCTAQRKRDRQRKKARPVAVHRPPSCAVLSGRGDSVLPIRYGLAKWMLRVMGDVEEC